ncbi:MAG: hypothetical protein P9M14_13775, partial [Candidatus Alcyoniella australis]|nr:hypothetical protein [Candidatus Alcyoniella australis]
HVDRFLMVVNASNEDKIWAWINLVNDGKALIDRSWPIRSRMQPAVIKRLRDPQWGEECKVLIALQGRGSRDALYQLMQGAQREQMMLMRKRDLIETVVADIDVVLSRTGYTGEAICYELFVHPDRAAQLWRKLLDLDVGVTPCGLGARDSLRTEVGLPLYGHELAGPFEISPNGAGFGGYVKLHKPFFNGKTAYIASEAERDMKIIRFRVPQKGTRPLKHGDPLTDHRGAFAGNITSCVVDGRGTMVGLAYVPQKYADEKSLLAHPLPAGKAEPCTPIDLGPGKRLVVSVQIKVMPRFPRKDVTKESE